MDFIFKKKDRFIYFFFTILAVLALVQVAIISLIMKYEDYRVNAYQIDEKNNSILTEIMLTSDNLTKFARLYAISANPKFKEIYYKILAIKEGTAPRPKYYEYSYWNLVEGGMTSNENIPALSLNDLILSGNFDESEIDLLRQSEDYRTQLQDLEIQAINAVDGIFDDGSGSYSIKKAPDLKFAQNLLIDENYLSLKAQILKPLEECSIAVQSKTTKEISRLNKEARDLIFLDVLVSIFSGVIMFLSINRAINTLSYTNKENELLLLNILPQPIAVRLKEGEDMIADEFSQASVLFADIVGFTKKTKEIGSSEMVGLLNELFGRFDSTCEEYKIEKIKTIGDCYMAVCGLPIPQPNHIFLITEFALQIKKITEDFSKEKNIPIQIRIGMNFGRVIAGVIGHKKFIYDLWGDVVNTASRMESSGIPNEIQITEKMAYQLEDSFILESRDEVEVKSLGKIKTFLVKGKKKK